MTTAQKLQEIIEKGGFEARVADTILASKNYKCSLKQWEIIQCSHDDLDWTELNVVDIDDTVEMARSNARFEDWNQEQIDLAKRTHLN